MNKIIIKDNILENYSDEYLIINDNSITFLKSNEYNISYINSTNINIKIILKDNIDIKLFIISNDNNLIITDTYSLGEYSSLTLSKFYNNKETKENTLVYLNGSSSSITSNFSSISSNRDNHNLKIYHDNSNTKSIISNKSIGLDNSKIDFIIDSILPKGNTNCVMDQTTKILTLGDVDAKISPNMFIEEDSVTAKHGSVISSFNEEEIFYLQSRGISEEEAIYLLIKGFIFSNLDLNMENKSIVYDCINNIRR